MANVIMGFGYVEAVLAAVNSVASNRRTAFQARIRNFQRVGLLDDIKPTRGNVPRYNPHHLLLLGLSVELAQLGVTPERAVRLLNENMTHVVIASRIASNWLMSGEKEIMYLYLDPRALVQLMDPSADENVSETFFYGGWPVVRELMDRGGTGHLRRVALINLTELICQLCDELNQAQPVVTTSEFLLSVQDWTLEKLLGPDDTVDELALPKESAKTLRLRGAK